MISLLSNLYRSRLIYCLVPTLVFVTVSLLIFSPQTLTQALLNPQTTNVLNFTSMLTIIAVISFALGYLLMIMNWLVVRIFEGHCLPMLISNILMSIQERRQVRFARRVRDNRHELEEVAEGTELFQQCWRHYIELKNEYHELFPPEARNTLPTRLGNVYRAFEDYSFKRYGIDSLFFWERLAKVIPEDYAGKVEELNNTVVFLLSSSLLSFIVTGELIILSIVNWEFSRTRFLLSLLCLFFGYSFYHMAVPTAQILGRHIRTCYDLFRLDLLDELNVERPKTFGGQEEKALWRSVHEFLVLGEDSPYIEPESE